MSSKNQPIQKLQWFRMYTDFLNDPKIIALAFEDQRHFIGLLALKAEGVLDQDCEPDLLDRIVAQRLWIDHAIIRDVKKRLVAGKLIDQSWQPLAWDKRQMRSDVDPTNAERQKRYRERKKKEAAQKKNQIDNKNNGIDNGGVDSNGSNALRNAPVTPLEENRIEENREEDITDNTSGVTTKKDTEQKENAIAVLEYLNEKTNCNYRQVATNLDFIIARFNDGATVEDCFAVINAKCEEWCEDEKMQMYLRPATLFNRTRFEQYIGQLNKKRIPKSKAEELFQLSI